MLRGVYEAASGMLALQHQEAVLAGNLANAGTPGYLAEEPTFATTLALSIQSHPGGPPVGPLAFGVADATDNLSTAPSQLTVTGRPLDIALGSNVFFRVATPTGTGYARDGALSVNAQGYLVTPEGYLVLGSNGAPIQVGSAQGVTITGSGQVQRGGQVIGSLALFTAPATGMLPGATGLYVPKAGTVPAPGGTVTPGALALSNVDQAVAMADVVQTVGLYQADEEAAHVQAQAFANLLATGVQP